MSKKVIIIGAGVGGLATAVRLLSRGYNVTIYEKEEKIGGKVNRFEINDLYFDLTASILMTPQIYKEVFEWANIDYNKYLDFIRIDPIYRVYYEDGTKYDFSSDLVKLTKLLESISIKDAKGFIKLLGEVYEKYLIADKSFLRKSFNNASDFINPITITKALRIKTITSIYDFISKYIKDEKLRNYLCFQSMYVGISPFNGPNIYTLIPAVTHLYGLWYLKGGMYAYIKALEKVIIELGGTINTNTDIEEILISQDRAIGIKTKYGTKITGDIIICNADFPYAVKELIRGEKAKGKYNKEKINNMKYSCSTFIIYVGLKKKYNQLSTHNLYLVKNFKESIEAPFIGNIPKNPCLYIYCPSRLDNTMASYNKECLNITVRVPNLLFNNINWNDKKIYELRNKIFKNIKNIDGLEDIEDNIIYESYLTPVDLLKSFNSFGGTAFGLSHTLTQTNYFRPQVKSSTVKNLYFVGSSVHPGTGVSIVLLSSKLAAEEVINNN